jgi:hypothetical protein
LIFVFKVGTAPHVNTFGLGPNHPLISSMSSAVKPLLLEE